jgi:hypothetical protein
LEPVVGIVVEMDETVVVGKVVVVVDGTVVVVDFDTGWALASEHFLVGPSRKNLDDFSIQDYKYWSKGCSASEN